MAVKPDTRPTAKQVKEHAEETTQRTIVTPGLNAATTAPKPKTARKPKPLMGKFQARLKALLIWRLKIAAAHEGERPNEFVARVLKDALRPYDYPTIPEWLKGQAESEDQASRAA
jgi:hypothetical protein